MTAATIILLGLYIVVVLLCVKPFGLYMAHVMAGTPIWPLRAGAAVERLAYRAAGVDPAVEMDWKHYAISLLLFNTVGALVVYAALRCALLSTMENSEPRYTLEMMPLLMACAACAIAGRTRPVHVHKKNAAGHLN